MIKQIYVSLFKFKSSAITRRILHQSAVMSMTGFNTTSAVRNFRDYLRIKTVQPSPDYDGAVTFLKKMSEELQLSYTVHECVAGKPVFIMTWPGSDPSLPSLLLNSHIDVVPVFPECWKYGPFDAVIDDKGDIYARGTQDMKCVGIQYIEAIRKLKSDGRIFPRTIHLSFVPDEEIGGHDGMKLYVKTEPFQKLNVGFALDEGLACPTEEFMIYYGERSPWWVEIICHGNPGHGSIFIENNAAEKLRRVVNSALQFRDEQESRLKADSTLALGDVISLNLTMIEGGVQPNVVPSEFRATVDIRIPPSVNMKQFEETIKDWCRQAGNDVTYRFKARTVFQGTTSIGADNKWWTTFKQTVDTLGLKTKVTIFPGATDSRYLREVGCPAIGFSPMNNTPVLLHDHNEFLNSGVFLRGIDIYEAIISNLACVST